MTNAPSTDPPEGQNRSGSQWTDFTHASNTRDEEIISAENRSPFLTQSNLISLLVGALSQVDGVINIGVRGSLAKNQADKYSDIDIFVITENVQFVNVIERTSNVIKSLANALTEESWVDDIVPNFGGIGLIYAVEPEKDKLIQLDYYVLPESNAQKILVELKERELLYVKRPAEFVDGVNLDNNLFTSTIESYQRARDPEFQRLFGGVLLFGMLTKHICRGRENHDPQLATDYLYSVKAAVRQLIRIVIDPATEDYHAYDFRKQIGPKSPIFAGRLDEIFQRTANPYDANVVLDLFDLFRDIACECLPVHYEKNKLLLEKYKRFLELQLDPK